MSELYRSAAGRQQVREWCLRQLAGWEVPHRHMEIDTEAGPTHVTVAGTATANTPSVILIPGTNTNTAVYLPVVQALARRWRTMTLDVPGQPGLSAGTRPTRGRSAWYGQWLSEVLEQVTDQPAVIVGHSLGAAITLACDSPKIAARVLVSPAGLVRLRIPPVVLRATLPWLLRPTPQRATRVLAPMLAPGTRVPDTLAQWMNLVARTCHSTLAPPPLPHHVLAARQSVPCLVATGEHDIFLPPHLLAPAAHRLLGTRLRTLTRTGHLVLDQHPDSFTHLTAEILRPDLPGSTPVA